VDRSKAIGLDFEGEVQRLQTEADWDALLAEATDPDVTLPAYYTQPFHAYDMGEQQPHARSMRTHTRCTMTRLQNYRHLLCRQPVLGGRHGV
jgi:hypothetical protein